MVKLSILIPMYNAEKYIGRCLKSVLHQGIDFKEYEIIIVDDGSSDSCVNIVREFQKSYPNIRLYQEQNVGAYSTRNKLLKLAKGDYIYCLDADDYLIYNSLNHILSLAMDKNLEITGFNSKVTLENEDYHTKVVFPEVNGIEIQNGTDFFISHPQHRFEIWWYLIKRSFLEENNLIFDTNEHNADVLFTFRLFLNATRVAHVPISLHRYFQSSDSIMRSTNDMQRKKLLVNFYNMIVDFNWFIGNYQKDSRKNNHQIVDHLIRKRDDLVYTFTTLIIKSNLCYRTIDKRLNSFQRLKIYPIKNQISPNKILSYITNKKTLIFPLAIIYRSYYRVH